MDSEALRKIQKLYLPKQSDFVIEKTLSTRAVQVKNNDNKRYIIKYAPQHIKNETIESLLDIQAFVNAKLKIGPCILTSINNTKSVLVEDQVVYLTEFLQHIPFASSTTPYLLAGQILGKLHATLRCYKGFIPESSLVFPSNSYEGLQSLKNQYEQNNIGSSWHSIINEKISILECLSKQNISPTTFLQTPKSPIHGDFHLNNILLSQQHTLAGIIDYDLGGYFYQHYEFMKAVMSIARNNGQIGPTPEEFLLFITGYKRHSTFSKDDLYAMIDMYALIQASDCYCLDITSIQSEPSNRKYAKYRFLALQWIIQNKSLLLEVLLKEFLPKDRI